MEGLNFIIDKNGKKIGVVLDYEKYKEVIDNLIKKEKKKKKIRISDFAGYIEQDELKQISDAISKDCEKVDGDEW